MSVDQAASVSLDARCEQIASQLRAELGDQVLAVEIQRNELVARIDAAAWVEAATACRRKLGMDYFCFLSGLDWLDSPLQTTRYENVWGTVEDEDAEGDAEGDGDDAVAEASDDTTTVEEVVGVDEAGGALQTGLAGGNSRFQVMARYYSTKQHRGITLKADLDENDPRVPTISGVYGGADWHERETWEMFGFWFDGHPHLVHIYLPGSFEGYPLRKDFPLLAREVKPWPGLTNVEPISAEALGAEEAAG